MCSNLLSIGKNEMNNRVICYLFVNLTWISIYLLLCLQRKGMCNDILSGCGGNVFMTIIKSLIFYVLPNKLKNWCVYSVANSLFLFI